MRKEKGNRNAGVKRKARRGEPVLLSEILPDVLANIKARCDRQRELRNE